MNLQKKENECILELEKYIILFAFAQNKPSTFNLVAHFRNFISIIESFFAILVLSRNHTLILFYLQ